jgi:hypothetical protein
MASAAFPATGDPAEYAVAFEAAYPNANDRRTSPEPTPISQGFPSYEQMLRDILAKLEGVDPPIKVNFLSIYAMNRVLTQLTHTSILGMIGTVQASSDADLSVGQELPVPLRALVVHAGAASVVNVSRYSVFAFADNDADEYGDWLG